MATTMLSERFVIGYALLGLGAGTCAWLAARWHSRRAGDEADAVEAQARWQDIGASIAGDAAPGPVPAADDRVRRALGWLSVAAQAPAGDDRAMVRVLARMLRTPGGLLPAPVPRRVPLRVPRVRRASVTASAAARVHAYYAGQVAGRGVGHGRCGGG
jgi:hypothetical protein